MGKIAVHTYTCTHGSCANIWYLCMRVGVQILRITPITSACACTCMHMRHMRMVHVHAKRGFRCGCCDHHVNRFESPAGPGNQKSFLSLLIPTCMDSKFAMWLCHHQFINLDDNSIGPIHDLKKCACSGWVRSRVLQAIGDCGFLFFRTYAGIQWNPSIPTLRETSGCLHFCWGIYQPLCIG